MTNKDERKYIVWLGPCFEIMKSKGRYFMKSNLMRFVWIIVLTAIIIVIPMINQNKYQGLAFIGIHSAGQSNPSVGGAEIQLSAETARVALAGDVVTILPTTEPARVEGSVLSQTAGIRNRFLVAGNGRGAVVVGNKRYEVLALDWSGKQEVKRTVHQPWREAELSLKELAAAPEQFIGRLYLLSGEIAVSSQGKSILGRKEGNARLFESFEGPVWVTNCPPGNKERQNQATFLVEVRAAGDGEWSLFCHRTIPVLGWKEPEFKRERVVGDKITLPTEKADKVSILTGDLILVELRHTRSSKERYAMEGACLKQAMDLTEERSAGSYERILLRGVKPGEGTVRVYYRWWQDPVDQVVAYKVIVAP